MSRPDEFLTVKEVADLLKLNQQTVYNWIDRGELPVVRVGQRRVRIKRSDFDALIEGGYSGRQQTSADEPSIWDGDIPLPESPEP